MNPCFSVLKTLVTQFEITIHAFPVVPVCPVDGLRYQAILPPKIRSLGPYLTRHRFLLFAGRAGSALTAEIGLMKATEQLSSLEMMAIDPLKRIIAPRFWAGFIRN